MTQQEFEQIAAEMRDVMVAVGRDFFGNREDADDVAQEGLLQLWKFRDKMEAGKSHHALARRIAKHCCMDLHRKRKDYRLLHLEDGKIPDTPATATASSPHEELEASEVREALDQAIGHLKPSERNLFELRQMEGLSLDEIASQTHTAKASIRSMVSTARRKVFEELKRSMNR